MTNPGDMTGEQVKILADALGLAFGQMTTIGNGILTCVHRASVCAGENCWAHNPSSIHTATGPIRWRAELTRHTGCVRIESGIQTLTTGPTTGRPAETFLRTSIATPAVRIQDPLSPKTIWSGVSGYERGTHSLEPMRSCAVIPPTLITI